MEKNIENIQKIGEQMLKKPVSRVNLDIGILKAVENGGTNEQALVRFAKLLSEERRLRKQKWQQEMHSSE